MIQNFSHKHVLLIAQCVCRNSPPGKRSSLFYLPYPHRHKFSTEANFRGSYFYLLDIDWSCLGWSNILALLSSTVFHLSRSSWGNRWKNDEQPEKENVFLCLRLFHLVLDRRHQLRIKIPQQGQVDPQISLLGKRLRHLVTSILFYFGGMPCSAVDPQRLQHFQSCTNVNIQMLESPRFPNLDYVLKMNPQNSFSWLRTEINT